MEKTVLIEGMMCPHCSNRVKEVLSKLDGVTEVTVSHEAGNAIIKSDKEISDEVIKNTIETAGYVVKNI